MLNQWQTEHIKNGSCGIKTNSEGVVSWMKEGKKQHEKEENRTEGLDDGEEQETKG